MKLSWMVMGSGVPTYVHETRESAVTEANRLARVHRGATFRVIAVTDRIVATDIQHDAVESTEIPL